MEQFYDHLDGLPLENKLWQSTAPNISDLLVFEMLL